MKIIECRATVLDLGRKRLLFSLKNEEGNEAFGEISPYPSLNLETFEEAVAQFNSLVPLLKTNCALIKSLALFPSVAFGIKSALLQLQDPLPPFLCPFSALLQGSLKEIDAQAERYLKLGIKSAKLKLAPFSLSEAKELVNVLKSEFFLRIDLNQKWEAKKVYDFFSSYSPTDFDYIEDPFQDINSLSSFTFPFAIDARPNGPLSFPMKTLVVKPTILKEIPSIEKPIVLSSCFDTGVNIFHLAQLSKRLKLSLPHGFGPYLFLEKDVLNQSLIIENGFIHIPNKIGLDVPLSSL